MQGCFWRLTGKTLARRPPAKTCGHSSPCQLGSRRVIDRDIGGRPPLIRRDERKRAAVSIGAAALCLLLRGGNLGSRRARRAPLGRGCLGRFLCNVGVEDVPVVPDPALNL